MSILMRGLIESRLRLCLRSGVPTDRMSKLPTLRIIAAKTRHQQRFYPHFRYVPNVTDKGLSASVTKVFTFSGFLVTV